MDRLPGPPASRRLGKRPGKSPGCSCIKSLAMFDKLHEECGVVAIYGHPEAANLAYLGLYALQHRGQESAGICSSDDRQIYCHKAMGHVAEIFAPEVLG